AERVFLTSTTHGAEMSALGAFIKTMEILEREKVVAHFWKYGSDLVDGMNDIAKESGIQDYFYAEGFACSPNYITKDKQGNASLALRTFFSQEMINNGVLMPYIALSMAHSAADLDRTLHAVRKALAVYARALNDGVEAHLKSPVIKPVFRKFN